MRFNIGVKQINRIFQLSICHFLPIHGKGHKHSTWIPRSDRIIWYIMRDDRSCTNNDIIPDMNILENNCIHTDKNVVSDGNLTSVSKNITICPFQNTPVISMINNHNTVRNLHITPDGQFARIIDA